MRKIIEIDETLFKEQILEGMTIKQLQDYWGCSRTTITSRKKLLGLVGLSPNSKKRDNGDGTKTCNMCKTVKSVNEFYSNGYFKGQPKIKPACKVCERNKRLTGWYLWIITELEKKGRKYACELCGYNNNYSALCFHHHTSEKNFELSKISRTTRNSDVLAEIDICKILCANCHSEIHNPTLNKELFGAVLVSTG